MPIHESRIARKERYPLEFDLQGIPREERDELLRQQQENLQMTVNVTNNSFAADQPQGGQVFDLNNPPRPRYTHKAFPKMVYHESGKTMIVNDAKELEKSQKNGFNLKPVAGHDYSKMNRVGVAPEAK